MFKHLSTSGKCLRLQMKKKWLQLHVFNFYSECKGTIYSLAATNNCSQGISIYTGIVLTVIIRLNWKWSRLGESWGILWGEEKHITGLLLEKWRKKLYWKELCLGRTTLWRNSHLKSTQERKLRNKIGVMTRRRMLMIYFQKYQLKHYD